MLGGLQHLSHGGRLRELGLFSWEKGPGRAQCDLPAPEGSLQAGVGPTVARPDSERRGNGFQVQEGRWRSDVRKQFCTGGSEAPAQLHRAAMPHPCGCSKP